MRYENIKKAVFLSRPNRFIACVEIGGETERIHVKNTGRCREILVPKAEIYIQEINTPNRKTKFDLISVRKGNRLINIDSQAPNKAVYEKLKAERTFKIEALRPEYPWGRSRFDFFAEINGRKSFIEVKGVTLENEGVVSFPDAPTERGVKHLNELMAAKREGFDVYVIFVVQMKNVRFFTPNFQNDPMFSETLIRAEAEGVNILAYDCRVTEDEMTIEDRVPIKLRR